MVVKAEKKRYVDQKNQWKDTTPKSTKAKQKKAWDELTKKKGGK